MTSLQFRKTHISYSFTTLPVAITLPLFTNLMM